MLVGNFNSVKPKILERCLFLILNLFFISVPIIFLTYSFAGISVQAYNIFGVIFVILFSLIIIRNPRISLYKKHTTIPIVFLLLAMFIASSISFIGALMNLGGDLAQFSKGLVEIIFFTIFFISLIFWLGGYKYQHADYFLRLLLGVIFISCIYQFLAIYLKVVNDVDLDSLIWPLISSWSSNEVDTRIGAELNIMVIRHGGFSSNPNSLSALLLAAIPLAIYFAASGSKLMYGVVSVFLLTMLTTLSRSGLLGLATSLTVMALLSNKLSIKKVIYGLLAIMLLPLLLLFVEKLLDVNLVSRFFDLIYLRLSGATYLDSPRYDLLEAGIDIISKSPVFGAGINSSPIILENYKIFEYTGGDLHNYWLELFVALGIFVIPTFLYYIYLLCHSFISRSIYSKALFASLCGLIVNATFQSSLAMMAVQVFILLLFLASLSPKANNKEQLHKIFV